MNTPKEAPPGRQAYPYHDVLAYLPGAAAIGFIAAFIYCCLAGDPRHGAIASGDSFLHLRIGQEILKGHALPHVDTMSFTRGGYPYIAHGWGFEVLIATLYRALGLSALVVLTACAAGGVTALVTQRCRLRGAGLDATFGALCLVLPCVSGFSYFARPHLVTLLGFAAGLYLLDQGAWKTRSPKTLVFAFFAMAAWTCFHPGSLVFLAVLGLELGCGAALDRKQAPWALGVLLVSALGVLATPYGTQVPQTVLHFMGEKRVFFFITEHLPLDPASVEGELFILIAAITCGSWIAAWAGRFKPKPTPGETLVAVFFIVLTCFARRWGGIAAIVMAPRLALVFNAGRPLGKTNWHWRLRDTASIAAAVALITTYLAALPDDRGLKEDLAATHPVAAVEFIRSHAELFRGPMFNAYDYGGYLAFALPEHELFVDGRAELYGAAFLDGLEGISRDAWVARTVFEKLKIDWAIFPRQNKLGATLLQAGWKVAFQDARTSVLVRPHS